MEINAQQMEALLRSQERQSPLPGKQSGQPAGFDALLDAQLTLQTPQTAISAGLAGQAIQFNPAIYNDAVNEERDPDSAVLLEAFDQASGALDLWDTYAKTLGTSTTDTALRDAWGLLEGIDARVAQLRDNPMRARSSALDSILNELEVLTTTEKFKFNRGDYLS